MSEQEEKEKFIKMMDETIGACSKIGYALEEAYITVGKSIARDLKRDPQILDKAEKWIAEYIAEIQKEQPND